MNSNKDSQQRVLLFQSISQFFEINGFSKTLKNFRKEANIQKDDGESCPLNIEEMFFEYLKSRNQPKDDIVQDQGTKQKSGAKTKEEGGSKGKKSEPTMENGIVDDAKVKSKKSKKSKNAKDASDQITEEAQPKITEKPEEAQLSLPSEPEKKSKDKKKKHIVESEPVIEDVPEKQSEVAVADGEKKKKKKKRIDESEPVIENVPEKQAEVAAADGEKKKKKKKCVDESESVTEDVPKKQSEAAATDGEKKEKKEKKAKKVKKEKNESNDREENAVAADEETKESNKRKRPSDDGADHVKETAVKGSKLRKIDDSDKSNGIVQTPNGSANGVLEKDEKEMSQKHKKTKELDGSAEPKTAAKAFQRVKPEDVQFADERLQDNSYWAKGGADSGYGAKAQEVLGQVRGRDFRHEKTKKKRGSYRGGQIDLDSHSVKFDNGDDEE